MILLSSCSIIDVHAYPERKQNNFYYNIKNKNTQKLIQNFQHHISQPIRS